MARIQTDARCRAIVNRVGAQATVGIDPSTLLSIVAELLPTLIKCFRPDDSQQAQLYVLKRWDARGTNLATKGYDKRLLKSVTRNVKNAASTNRTLITWDQAQIIAIATLDDIRLGDLSQGNLVIRECDFMLV